MSDSKSEGVSVSVSAVDLGSDAFRDDEEFQEFQDDQQFDETIEDGLFCCFVGLVL